MKLPESEIEREELARELIRKGYGGFLPRILNKLVLLTLPKTSKYLIERYLDKSQGNSEFFFGEDLTELGEYLLDFCLKEKKIRDWDSQKKVPLSPLTDRDLINYFNKEKARVSWGKLSGTSLDLLFLAAEIKKNRPHLKRYLRDIGIA